MGFFIDTREAIVDDGPGSPLMLWDGSHRRNAKIGDVEGLELTKCSFLLKAKAFCFRYSSVCESMKCILISGSHNPSGVIGWSWEMVNANWKIPIVVLPDLLFLCDGITHSYQFLWKK